jgi:protein-disulfide isomerase
LAALLVAVFVSSAPAADKGITKEQADAILNELKEMHKQLDKLIELQVNPAKGGPAVLKLKFAPGAPMLGKAGAPITIVEFLDLQCPYCKRFEDTTFASIRKELIETGKVRYVSVDFPLEMHTNAKPAAVAAHCAGEQGKFWELRDLLLQNASNLGAEAILNHAKAVGLDQNAFAACLKAGKYSAQIDAGEREALELGVEGTPSFLVGKSAPGGVEGTLVVGSLPFSAFEAAIQKIEAK